MKLMNNFLYFMSVRIPQLHSLLPLVHLPIYLTPLHTLPLVLSLHHANYLCIIHRSPAYLQMAVQSPVISLFPVTLNLHL